MININIAVIGGLHSGKTSIIKCCAAATTSTNEFSEEYVATTVPTLVPVTYNTNYGLINVVYLDVPGKIPEGEYPNTGDMEDILKALAKDQQVQTIRGCNGVLRIVNPHGGMSVSAWQDTASNLENYGTEIPEVICLNKSDMPLPASRAERLLNKRCESFIKTSAKTGSGIYEAILELLRKVLKNPQLAFIPTVPTKLSDKRKRVSGENDDLQLERERERDCL